MKRFLYFDYAILSSQTCGDFIVLKYVTLIAFQTYFRVLTPLTTVQNSLNAIEIQRPFQAIKPKLLRPKYYTPQWSESSPRAGFSRSQANTRDVALYSPMSTNPTEFKPHQAEHCRRTEMRRFPLAPQIRLSLGDARSFQRCLSFSKTVYPYGQGCITKSNRKKRRHFTRQHSSLSSLTSQTIFLVVDVVVVVVTVCSRQLLQMKGSRPSEPNR